MLNFSSAKQAEKALTVLLRWLRSFATEDGDQPVSVGYDEKTKKLFLSVSQDPSTWQPPAPSELLDKDRTR